MIWIYLALFAAWTLFLALFVVLFRVFQVVAGRVAANAFSSGTPHTVDGKALQNPSESLYWRANRAHLNALETLAPFTALVSSCE